MKKLICILVCLLMLCAAIPVSAAPLQDIVITRQPQNPTWPAGSDATYTVSAAGDNLHCYWHLVIDGTTYYLYDIDPAYGSNQPPYVESYTTSRDGNKFTVTLHGVSEELSGAELFADVEDGHVNTTSDKAIINVGGQAIPPLTMVAPAMEIYQGENLELYCEVVQQSGVTYEYLWYETGSGRLQDIMVIGGRTGQEHTTDTYRVDTSELGTRYYVCGVNGSNGGDTYTSVIAVTVIPRENNIPVLFTADSSAEIGGALFVDIEAMTRYDSAIYNAWLENTVSYAWYQDDKLFVEYDCEFLKIDESLAGKDIYVEVFCSDLVLTSEIFHISTSQEEIVPEILTPQLPNAVVGEEYSFRLKCSDPAAEFVIYYNPGHPNEFEETGLSFDTATGTFSGTPAAAGEYTFTVSAVNVDMTQSYMEYTLLVEEVQETEAAPTEPTDPPVADPVPKGNPVPLIIGITAGVAVCGGAAGLVIWKKKRKKPEI